MKQILTLISILLSVASAHAISWTVTKTQWTQSDEAEYSRFVEAIGLAREQGLCSTTESCIKKAPGNFLRTADDANLSMLVDCADLPYALRSYFAMKKGLPFSYSSEIAAAQPPDGSVLEERDIRYSTFGNLIIQRRQVVSGIDDFNVYWTRIANSISSGMYRVHPLKLKESLESDMYSSNIQKGSTGNPQGIHPGTNIYDPAGHVAVIYKIGKSGRIFYIDAHPDNSLTRGSYGQKFVRSRPFAGAGFKNFRPLSVVNGKAVLAANSQISDFSTIQYFGTNPAPQGQSWSKGTFVLNSTQLEYYDYVRAVMADGNVTIDPIVEVKEMTDGICLDIQDRMQSVRSAINKGIQLKAHPSRLPHNIYGTGGEWEEYSTPSRDARLKTSFKELRDNVAKWFEMKAQGSSRINYSGSNLKADLKATYNSVVEKCSLKYTNSNGSTVRFTINDVVDNLWKLSFSPYHCVELRWGGIGESLPAACNSSDKMYWYKAQQKLRNQPERTYDLRMDYTADELLSGAGSNLGTSNPPLVDVRVLFQ